ncbi:MAG: hypothetical protein ACKV2Q_10850 [Planctomycetaceae bacterium]
MEDYVEDVFINCPFDEEYRPLFDAMLFVLMACGFKPRCALEAIDGSEVRIEKLFRMIAECRLAIHDLSRVQLSQPSQLPRFNMPLELGVWLGAKRFGPRQRNKVCLILDAEPHRYQKFVSDIAGQDPVPHADRPDLLVTAIRDWLQTVHPNRRLPGGHAFAKSFQRFLRNRIGLAKAAGLEIDKLTFLDRVRLVEEWLEVNTVAPTS